MEDSTREMSNTNRYLPYVFVAVQFVCLGLIAVTGPLIARNPVLLAAEAFGIFMGLWAIWAMRLGNFNITPTVKPGAPLVEAGPYRYIRHPMYSGLLLLTAALVLDQFSILRLAIWLVLLADLLLKLRHEEKLLAAEVDGYSRFMQRTKKVLPFVY